MKTTEAAGLRNLLSVTLLLLVLVSLAPSAWAQATTSVRGAVTDPSSSAVVGANVTLSNAESKTERAVTTGDRGEYQFLLIPPGSYTLTVKAAGFRLSEFKLEASELAVSSIGRK